MPDIYHQTNVVLSDIANIGSLHACVMRDGSLILNTLDRDGRPKASIRISSDQASALTDWLVERCAYYSE